MENGSCLSARHSGRFQNPQEVRLCHDTDPVRNRVTAAESARKKRTAVHQAKRLQLTGYTELLLAMAGSRCLPAEAAYELQIIRNCEGNAGTGDGGDSGMRAEKWKETSESSAIGAAGAP